MTNAINLAAESSRTNASVQSPTLNTSSALRRRADSARRAVRLLLDVVAAPFVFIAAFFGVEASIGERRGYVELCEHGCRDVHDLDDICPRAIVADCDICVRSSVELDASGNCPFCGNRRVLNRRSKATGKRLRFAVISPPTKLTARLTVARSSSRFPERIGAAAGRSDMEGSSHAQVTDSSVHALEP